MPRPKAELAKHHTEITLTPEADTYKRSGELDLLGDVRSDAARSPDRAVRATQFSLLVTAWPTLKAAYPAPFFG
jgi:hypothetical protein